MYAYDVTIPAKGAMEMVLCTRNQILAASRIATVALIQGPVAQPQVLINIPIATLAPQQMLTCIATHADGEVHC